MKKQDWIISITDVEAVTDTQEPYLSLKINDKWAYIPRRQTFTIIMNGCLSLVGDPRKLKTSNLFYFDLEPLP